MISSVAWVPRGVADPHPKRYEISQGEKELLQQKEELVQQQEQLLLKEQTSEQDDAVDNSNNNNINDTLPADLRMDEYSSDDEEEDGGDAAIGNLLLGKDEVVEEEKQDVMEDAIGQDKDSDTDSDDDEDDDDLRDVPDTREFMPLDAQGLEAMGLGVTEEFNINEDEDDDDSDAEDHQISPSDAILLVAKTEDDFASLEVHVYEEDSGNLFVHHDICLPSFPLCLAHGNLSGDGKSGNYCAVGTFDPLIEIWNLDVLNALEPSVVLGVDTNEKISSKNNNNTTSGHHADAVMSLSWNKIHRQVLCSGSADCTVKLWDITSPSNCSSTLTHHSNKVGAVVWHPTEGTLLATSSYDRTVCLVDARSPDNVKTVKISADVEALNWDPFEPHLLTAATEDGTISTWDVRNFQKQPLWSIVANDYGGVTDFSYNHHIPGFMVSCAIDKTVTLWDCSSGNTPTACGQKDMGVGRLHTVSFYPSSPFLLACGGGGNEVALWDLTNEQAIQNRFGSRVKNGSNVENTVEEDEQSPREKENNLEENFESIMAANDGDDDATKAAKKKTSNNNNKNKNKKKKKGKQKAHKKGR